MDSGIYVLRFRSGHYYIGKSDNIPNRWKQHWKDFEKGTHSKRMQWCYDNYGEPMPEVFLECHSDHVDMYESIIIRMNLGDMCLNGNMPREIPPEDVPTLMNNGQFVSVSTAEHFRMILKLEEDVEDKEGEIELLRLRIEDFGENGIVLPDEMEELIENQKLEISTLEDMLQTSNKELTKLKNRNWFQRLFNI
jgi:hypothetical protein